MSESQGSSATRRRSDPLQGNDRETRRKTSTRFGDLGRAMMLYAEKAPTRSSPGCAETIQKWAWIPRSRLLAPSLKSLFRSITSGLLVIQTRTGKGANQLFLLSPVSRHVRSAAWRTFEGGRKRRVCRTAR
jgi:hypothetical protein